MNREAPSYKEGDKDTSFICDRNLDRKKIIEDIINKNELSNFKQYLTKVSTYFIFHIIYILSKILY